VPGRVSSRSSVIAAYHLANSGRTGVRPYRSRFAGWQSIAIAPARLTFLLSALFVRNSVRHRHGSNVFLCRLLFPG